MRDSLQDVINAAYRIGDSTRDVCDRSRSSADRLARLGQELAVVTRPSRSGGEAAAQTMEAVRAVRQAVVALGALRREVDTFVRAARQ